MSCQGTWKIPESSEYRKKLDALNDTRMNTQRKEITDKLETAVRSGINRIFIEELMEEIKNELISLGYNVQKESGGGGRNYIIIP